MTTELQDIPGKGRTDIYKFTDYGEDRVGYVGPDQVIYRMRWNQGIATGRMETDDDGTLHIFRNTQHGEKEIGIVDTKGGIRSHGLFEGGDLGWLDPDGVVVQGGLILGEEEAGRVDGPDRRAAAAALLLLFIPDDDEAGRDLKRQN